ncbi:MAG: hypothetical protein OXM60_18995 [Defluviicoccus sp.]|nr:hypothetical protein [Defluviicoccus sp.]
MGLVKRAGDPSVRHPAEDVEAVQGCGRVVAQAHDDALRLGQGGNLEELPDHHGGAVVDVDGVREVEDDDLALLDVEADPGAV